MEVACEFLAMTAKLKKERCTVTGSAMHVMSATQHLHHSCLCLTLLNSMCKVAPDCTIMKDTNK